MKLAIDILKRRLREVFAERHVNYKYGSLSVIRSCILAIRVLRRRQSLLEELDAFEREA